MAKPTTQASDVSYRRPELVNKISKYVLIHDAIEGEDFIKGLASTYAFDGLADVGGGVAGLGNGGIPVLNNQVLTRARRYLPQPNAEDKSEQNNERYRAYVTRAIFYGVTGRTLEGMVGQIFSREPEISIPPALEILKTDASGSGLSLNQISGQGCRQCLAYGRGGVLVDYPVTDKPATKKDLANGDIRPTFTTYYPWQIINWRTAMRGAKRVLTLVVLCERIDDEDIANFAPIAYDQYRVLRLDASGNYTVEIWKKDGEHTKPDLTQTPKNSKGQPFKDIPFSFMGAEDNGVLPNRPPLYDLALVNIGHYRNSADYEEACFIAGQPTPVLSGLSEEWVKNILNGVVTLGSRAAIPLPVGAKAELLQATANSMPFEAMKHKEQQMVELGARLVQVGTKSGTQSATAKIIDESSENSVLANIARNVSAVILWALGVAADFVGVPKTDITFALNDDFDLTSLTADDQNAIIKQWQSAGISFEEMRGALRRGGIATQKDEVARTAIQKDIDDGMIPDPALANAPPMTADPKATSDAGGPQPTRIRRKSKPAGSK